MIIKATVNDNDYTHRIELFFDKFFIKMMDYIYDNGNDVIGGFNVFNKFQKLINPNVTTRLKAEDKEFLIDIITKAIIKYFDDSYITNNLKIDIVKTYTDKWENGEVIYFFSTHEVYVIN